MSTAESNKMPFAGNRRRWLAGGYVQKAAFLILAAAALPGLAADGYVDMVKTPPSSAPYTVWIDDASYWEADAAIDDPNTDYRIAAGYIVHSANTEATVLHGRSYTFGTSTTEGCLSGRYNGYVEFPNNGLFLVKGKFRQLSSGNRLEIRGKVRVDSSKASSSAYQIISSHVTPDSKRVYGFRPSSFLFSGDVTCPASNGLKLTWTKNNDNSGLYAEAGGYWPVTFSGDLSQYLGSFDVASNICFGVCDTVLPGSVTLHGHSQLAVSNATATATIGTLVFSSDNDLVLRADAANGAIGHLVVTGSLTMPTDRLRIVFDSLGQRGMAKYPVFTVGRDVSAAVGLNDLELVEKGGDSLVRAFLTEDTNANGDKVFSIEYDKRIVRLLKNDPTNVNLEYDTYSAFTNAASWSDNDWPTNRNAVYYTSGYVMRMPYDRSGVFTFQGGGLSVNNIFFIRQATNIFENLVLENNGQLYGFYDFSSYFFGNISVFGTGALRTYSGLSRTNRVDGLLNGYRVHSAIHGDGRLKITGNEGSVALPVDLVLYRNEASDFSGKIWVTLGSNPSKDYPNLSIGYVTFVADDISVLGVDLPAFTYDALQIDQMCRFMPFRTMTLAESSNRGIFIKGCGRIVTPSGVSFTVEPPISYDGLFRKEGPGELAIAAAARELSATCSVEVVEGSVRVRHADAFGAMPVTMAAGTKLVFGAETEDADLRANGLRRDAVATPFTAEGGRLTVAVDTSGLGPRVGSRTVALFTVKSADAPALANSITIEKPRGVRSRLIVAPVAETANSLISVKLTDAGVWVIIR